MKNKTIVKYWILGIALSFCGGFLSGLAGEESGQSTLLTLVGTVIAFIFAIWGMVRLWNAPDPDLTADNGTARSKENETVPRS